MNTVIGARPLTGSVASGSTDLISNSYAFIRFKEVYTFYARMHKISLRKVLGNVIAYPYAAFTCLEVKFCFFFVLPYRP